MSGTTPPAPETVATTWGAPVVSIYSLTVFLVALLIAYFAKNDTALTLLLGAASANATAVIQFWVGSSSSSQKKDAAAAVNTAAMTAAVTASMPGVPPVAASPVAAANTDALAANTEATRENTEATTQGTKP